jgi:hypothetical protein
MLRRDFARGFALVDAIMGGILLGLALVSIIGLTGTSLSAQAKGEQLQTAAALADERLNLVLATGVEGYSSVFPMKGPCDSPFEQYSFEVTFVSQGDSNPYLVKAEIRWDGQGGGGARAQSLVVETLIAPRLGDDPDPDRKPLETLDRAGRDAGDTASTTGSGNGGGL